MSAAIANGRPADGVDLHLGPNGSVVFACVEMGLAPEMRRVLFPAVCHWREGGATIKKAAERRTVIVAYCGAGSRTEAETLATWIQAKCHPERVATLDLTEKMGFSGPPESFVPWWEEASGVGHFADGADFVHQAELRADRRNFSIISMDDDDDGADVDDPIGELDPVAFHGPLGRLALATQRETEANPAFVLIHLLAYFGATIGRRPHFTVSATRHRLNLFVATVGPSGNSRKTTAGDVATETWRKIDSFFTAENITDGLNSGAGLLWHLRDRKTKPVPGGEPVVIDEGVEDKRRVFLETELGSVLKQGSRENDPLTDHLRKFWDGKEAVRSNVRNDPLKVTGGHVSLVGHITTSDVDVYLSAEFKANGFANRFLWLYGTRSKLLPSGGDVFGLLNFLEADLQEIEQALEFARGVDEIHRSADVNGRWDDIYREFADTPPGKLGVFFVRAAPQVMRLASIFALADRSRVIQAVHLEAALAIWDYSVRSMRHIFGTEVDPDAEKLLAALRDAPEGLTKTEIAKGVFQKNKGANTVDALLSRLLAERRIFKGEPASKGGRPAARYRLTRL